MITVIYSGRHQRPKIAITEKDGERAERGSERERAHRERQRKRESSIYAGRRGTTGSCRERVCDEGAEGMVMPGQQRVLVEVRERKRRFRIAIPPRHWPPDSVLALNARARVLGICIYVYLSLGGDETEGSNEEEGRGNDFRGWPLPSRSALAVALSSPPRCPLSSIIYDRA